MMRNATRGGFTLVELITALTLLLVVLAIGGITARQALATQARISAHGLRADGVSDALRTLARHAANLDPAAGDLRAAHDSAFELQHLIGIATACRSTADTLLLSNAADSLPWASSLPRAVTADDLLRTRNDADAPWQTRRIRSVGTASGTCGDSALAWPDHAAQRLVLDGDATPIRPGAILLVLQRERWSLVRGGDGNWSLAMATWDAARHDFGTPQPLLSPLAAPTAPDRAGFVARAIGAGGETLVDSASLLRARSVVLSLRTKTHARHGQFIDSVRVNVGAH